MGTMLALRAAFRAIDLVLPKLEPSKSAQFALLPEGKDPDDIVSVGGSPAMREILSSAQPLIQMLWNRETMNGQFDTPEKRAELETRLKTAVNTIRHEDVRRYYSQDVFTRLRDQFAPQTYQNTPNKNAPYANQYRGQRGGNRGNSKNRFAASPSLLASRHFKSASSDYSLRDCAILGGIMFHPVLGFEFFEELSNLEFSAPTIRQALSITIDCFVNVEREEGYPDRETIQQAFLERQAGEILETIKTRLKQNGLWQLLPEASYEDAVT